MDIKAYERIWVRGLTPRMRNLLIWVAQHKHHEPWPPWANGNTAKALRHRGYITTYPYQLTDEGRALIEVNAGHALMVDTTPAADDTEVEPMWTPPEAGSTFIAGLWRVTRTPLAGHPDMPVTSYELVSQYPDELKMLREFLEYAIGFAPDDIDIDGHVDYVARLIGLGKEARTVKRIIEKRTAAALKDD